MDNVLLPQYSNSESASRSHYSSWPAIACSTAFQTSSTNSTLCRYPPGLSGVRKRMDTDVDVQADCTFEECRQLFGPTPETYAFPAGQSTTEKDLETTSPHVGTYTLTRKPQLLDPPKKGRAKTVSSEYLDLTMGTSYDQGRPEQDLQLEHTETVVRETNSIPGTPALLEDEEESLQTAINNPLHQGLSSASEEEDLGSPQSAQPLVTGIQQRGPPHSENGSHMNKEVWRFRIARKRYGKAERTSSDHSSGLCVYRAARGCAVHPRSIAERVRRSRIAQRVKILETKLPDSMKTAGKRRLYTDELLERSIFYIKWLENSIEVLLNNGMPSAG